MNGLSQFHSAPYFHLLSCIGISKHRAAQWDRAAISLETNPTKKNPNWFNLLCGHMAASISIKAFKDKLEYSELVSLVWGFVVSFISNSTRSSCVWRVMVFLRWLPMLCVGFLWLGKIQVYFSSHFYNLYRKHLFDSYLGLAHVALLKSVGLHPSTLVCQFAGSVYLLQKMGCVLTSVPVWILVFLLELSAVRFLHL